MYAAASLCSLYSVSEADKIVIQQLELEFERKKLEILRQEQELIRAIKRQHAGGGQANAASQGKEQRRSNLGPWAMQSGIGDDLPRHPTEVQSENGASSAVQEGTAADSAKPKAHSERQESGEAAQKEALAVVDGQTAAASGRKEQRRPDVGPRTDTFSVVESYPSRVPTRAQGQDERNVASSLQGAAETDRTVARDQLENPAGGDDELSCTRSSVSRVVTGEQTEPLGAFPVMPTNQLQLPFRVVFDSELPPVRVKEQRPVHHSMRGNEEQPPVFCGSDADSAVEGSAVRGRDAPFDNIRAIPPSEDMAGEAHGVENAEMAFMTVDDHLNREPSVAGIFKARAFVSHGSGSAMSIFSSLPRPGEIFDGELISPSAAPPEHNQNRRQWPVPGSVDSRAALQVLRAVPRQLWPGDPLSGQIMRHSQAGLGRRECSCSPIGRCTRKCA